MELQGWLIPLALIMFLAFALADCQGAEPLFPAAPAAMQAPANP